MIPATEGRMSDLVRIRLDHGGPAKFDRGPDETGVSSADAVAFVKSVGQQFGVGIPTEAIKQLSKLGNLDAHLDAQSSLACHG